jgi:DNA-binding transcriptional LysR family regulator
MDLDTRDLRVLLAVADGGGLAGAAAALEVTESSVSSSVQRLETAVGRRLVSQEAGHLELTPVGAEVLDAARRIVESLDGLATWVRSTQDELRLGYAWAAFGEHTAAVQDRWEETRSGTLVLVQSNTPTAGLLEGRCDVAVVRRPVSDPRLKSVQVGTERPYAALASQHRLAGEPAMRLAALAGRTVAVDPETGATGADLWRPDAPPGGFRLAHDVLDWLTLVAAGQVIGISSAATAAEHDHPGVTFRLLEDASSLPVWVAWREDNPPSALSDLLDEVRSTYEHVES